MPRKTGLAPATPLHDVTFVVLDLETTGCSPGVSRITEVGAEKYRGGEVVGTFWTLVDPGVPLPPDIVYLTGITEALVEAAPAVDSVLPALAEFVGDAVVVGHNVRFDLGFLRADLARLGYPPLTNVAVDTLTLSRRLLGEEVPDFRLGTLARHFQTEASACHRALDDARATAEIFHRLLERVASLGVTELDDLLALPQVANHPQVAKLHWTADLPRRPGVFLFRDVAGRVLFVGRAGDLRRRVRSLFALRDGRRVEPLLREAASLEHLCTDDHVEAALIELRIVAEHQPRYHPLVRRWQQQRFLRVTLEEPFPRVIVVAADTPLAASQADVGPFATPKAAREAAEVLSDAFGLRRCSGRAPKRATQLATSPRCVDDLRPCPCLSKLARVEYQKRVTRLVAQLGGDGMQLQQTIDGAVARGAGAALVAAVRRQRRLEAVAADPTTVAALRAAPGTPPSLDLPLGQQAAAEASAVWATTATTTGRRSPGGDTLPQAPTAQAEA